MISGGRRLAPQHAGEFGDSGGPVKAIDGAPGSPILHAFADQIVSACRSGDRCQVSDAEDLPILGDLRHLDANHLGGFTTDIRIDLIEDEHRDIISRCQDRLDG